MQLNTGHHEHHFIGRNPISTSVGREAIESIWSQALGEETREVMADVLAEQIGGPEVARRAAWLKRGSFGAEKITAGEVFVQVDGICSCLGVDYTVHGSWRDHGFSEYTPHNVENREQRAALLAGLGHIARVANRHVVGRLSVT